MAISTSTSAPTLGVSRDDCIIRFVTLPISARFGQIVHTDEESHSYNDVERDIQSRFIIKALELMNTGDDDFVKVLLKNSKAVCAVSLFSIQFCSFVYFFHFLYFNTKVIFIFAYFRYNYLLNYL